MLTAATLLMLCVARLLAAISFNTGEVGANQSESATSITISLTLSGGTSLLACAAVTGAGSLSATWNTSENFTLDNTMTNSGYSMGSLYLLNPTSGAHNVVISQSGAATILLGACSAYSESSGGPETAATTGTRTDGNNINVSETTTANNAWVIGFFGGSGNVDPSAAIGNLRAKTHNPTAAFGQVGLLDFGPVTPAGAQAIEVNPNALSFDMLAVMSFAPAGGGGGGGATCRGIISSKGFADCR